MAGIFFSIILLSVSPVNAAAECYYPDGSLDDGAFVCDSTAEYSACCAQGNMCLTNGLCRSQETVVTSENTNDYWRDSCTDQTWTADACPKYCYNSTTTPSAGSSYYFVEACGTDTYACADYQIWLAGDHAGSCLDPLAVFTAGVGAYLAGPSLTTATIPSTASSSGSATHTTPTSLPPSATSAANPSSASAGKEHREGSSSLSSGAGIGIGVAVGVGAALIVAALIYGLYFRRRRAKNSSSKEMPDGVGQPKYYTAGGEMQGSQTAKNSGAVHQVGHRDVLAEAPNEREAAELR